MEVPVYQWPLAGCRCRLAEDQRQRSSVFEALDGRLSCVRPCAVSVVVWGWTRSYAAVVSDGPVS